MEHEELLIRQKLRMKKINAQKECLKCELTLDQFRNLMKDAGITAHDIGIKGYHLSRFNDLGDYTIDNCRFVFYKKNLNEKKVSDKSRLASKMNIMKANANRTFKSRSKAGKIGGKISGGHNKLKPEEIDHRLELIKKSGIDLKSYGWVSKVSKLLNCSHTQVKRFIDKHYKGDIYRRNN